MAFYSSYFIPKPKTDLKHRECSLEETVSNIPKNGCLVKVHYAGVCHTDLHQLEGGYQLSDTEFMSFADRPGYGYPRVPGHEVSGVVYSLGADVCPNSSVMVGDKVCVFAWMGCGSCSMCEIKQSSFCTGSSSCELGMCIDGGYMQYVIVPHVKYVLPVPSNVSMELGCTLSCGCLTAYNASRAAICNIPEPFHKVSSQLKVCIIGLGGVGQWTAKLLPLVISQGKIHKLQITGIDVAEMKLDNLKRTGILGETFLIDKSKPVKAQAQGILASTGAGFHAVIDCVNNSATFELATLLLRNGGVLVSVGLFGGTGTISLPLLPLRRHKIIGIQTGSLKDFEDLLMFLESLEAPVEGPQLTIYSLEDCMKAVNDVKEGKMNGRALLKCINN